MQVSASNWPDISKIGDVCNVRAADLPKIDLLIGGTPCQGFSFAGKRLNFNDPRSALFFEYVRILNEIRKINPDVIFLMENVPMKREHQIVISKYLGVEPIEINGALVSAQNRRRLFWTNIKARPFNLFGDMVSMIPQPKDKGVLLKDILQPVEEVDKKYYLSEKRVEFMLKKQGQFTQLNGEKSMTVTTRGDAGWQGDFVFIEQTPRGNNNGGQKAMNGKAPSVTSNQWEHNNHLRVHNMMPRSSKTGKSGTGHLPKPGDKTYCIDTGQTNVIELPNNDVSALAIIGAYTENGKTEQRIFIGGDKANSYTLTEKDSMVLNRGQYRRLTPIEVERLFTLPENYTAAVSDSQRYRCMGNGWVVDVIAHILSHIEK